MYLITIRNCPFCTIAKDYLDQAGIKYKEVVLEDFINHMSQEERQSLSRTKIQVPCLLQNKDNVLSEISISEFIIRAKKYYGLPI